MLSMSTRAPGYRFQYQVPPTPSPASRPITVRPSWRSRYSAYRPEKPAPTTTTSAVSVSAVLICAGLIFSAVMAGDVIVGLPDGPRPTAAPHPVPVPGTGGIRDGLLLD